MKYLAAKEPDMAEESAPLIRSALTTDVAMIHSIYADSVLNGTASFEITPPTVEEMRERWHGITSAGYPYLVAEFDGSVAGYAYVGPYRPRPAYCGTVESSIYVHANYRGAGLGRALLAALIARTTEAGFHQIIAVIGDSGNIASIEVHRREGFETVGTLRSVGWKHGLWLDTVLMQRPVGLGDAKCLDT